MTIAKSHAIELEALRAHLWDVASLLEENNLHLRALDVCGDAIVEVLELDNEELLVPEVNPLASWARKEANK